MPQVPREKIDEVRERTNIVEVVKRHVELKRAGTASFVGLCPFHAEKTPSFNVHEARQFFYCFGCGEKGDVFTFLTAIEQRSFPEVLQDLAREAGVELPDKLSEEERRARAEAESERTRMLRAVELATAFFEAQLRTPSGEAARAYFGGREVSDELARRFRLGYAPAAFDALLRHLREKQVPDSVAERLGLVGVNERGRYDFFRDRVMMPVLDRQGRPVGFSSRLLDPDAKDRKYVNSPDSLLFHKKEQLYGLHAAIDSIRRTGLAVLVEGNFDVLSLHGAGITQAVAPMGTALTAEQVGRLRPLAKRVVVVFDGDDAGTRASRKAVPLFVEANVDGRIARLPKGQDPDDFVRGEGADSFKKLIEEARPVVEQLIDDLAKATEATIPGRMSTLEEAAPVLARVQDRTYRELYAARLASTLGLSLQQVDRAIRAAAAGGSVRSGQGDRAPEVVTAGATDRGGGEVRAPAPREELEAVALLAAKPELLSSPEARRVNELLTDPELARLCRTLLVEAGEHGRFDVTTWLSTASAATNRLLTAALLDGRFDSLPDAPLTLRALVKRLERGRIEREIENTKQALAEAQKSGDEQAVRAIAGRQMELIRTKLGLSQAPLRP